MKTVLTIGLISLFASLELVAQDWYPLKKGNKWVYRAILRDGSGMTIVRTGTQVTEVVNDTLMPNGKTYTILKGTYLGNTVRVDSNKLFFYDGQDNETPIFRFDAVQGSCWDMLYGNKMCVSSDRGPYYADSLFGTSTRIKTFHHWGISFAFYYFSDKFGLLRIEDYQDIGFLPIHEWTLTGCVINDTTYGDLTSVERLPDQIPANFHLFPNYPNPFNAETNVQFSINSRTDARLTVYDLLGRQVAELHEGALEPGVYQTKWKPEGLNTGIYILRLQTPSNSFQRKILYLK